MEKSVVIKEKIIKKCQVGKAPELSLDDKGKLYLDGTFYDFNQIYAAYYPPCHFTAMGSYEGGYLAVGVTNGLAHDVRDSIDTRKPKIVAYSSLLGGVWQPENLMARTPQGIIAPAEIVHAVCHDEVSGQTFLLGNKGQVITLNGCPKCVKLSFFGMGDIIDGRIEEEKLYLEYADGSRHVISLHAATQLRLSQEAAVRKIEEGGILVWLGEERAVKGMFRIGNEILFVSDLTSFLQKQDKKKTLIFCCESGVKAEAASKSARAMGWRESYFLLLDYDKSSDG